jgi:hypothetical protein
VAFCGSKRVQKIPKTVPKQAKEKKPTGRKKERKQNRTEGMEALYIKALSACVRASVRSDSSAF